jgi:hypothetical protein
MMLRVSLCMLALTRGRAVEPEASADPAELAKSV